MARISAALTVARTTLGKESFTGVGVISDALNGASLATDQSAFETALATLVADGASPTQAHVTTVNNDYTTLKADITELPVNTDVVVSVNTTNCPTITALRLALAQLLRSLQGTGYFTP